MKRTRHIIWFAACVALLIGAESAWSQVRVQDIASLKGAQRARLIGYGLVVGLKGTGDGEKNAPTMRALAAMHAKFAAPTKDIELKGNASVAMVLVEAVIPESGADVGQEIDIVVSAIGTAKSLDGGHLMVTPLQSALMNPADPNTQQILAVAGGGPIELSRKDVPTRGIIRRGAQLETEFFYTFVEDGDITLVLQDEHASWQWSRLVARAINHELTAPLLGEGGAQGQDLVGDDFATALNGRFVRVHIPEPEQADPANFVSRILQAELFMLPEQAAVVKINRLTNMVSTSGSVRVSPTILQIPGFGMLMIGAPEEPAQPAADVAPQAALSPEKAPPVPLTQVLGQLQKVKATPEQIVNAIEQLHRTGTLHARLEYVGK